MIKQTHNTEKKILTLKKLIMTKFFSSIKKYTNLAFKTLLFIITVIIILFLFPSQGKFRYEFQKGSPWKHQNLIAPFNFAIQKSDKEISAEKDSIINNFKPYFKFDNKIQKSQLNLFHKNFNNNWGNYKHKNIPKHKLKIFKTESLNYCDSILNNIYNNGVVQFSEILKQTKKGSSIIVVKNNVAEERDISKVFTPKISYKYLKQDISEKFKNSKNSSEKIDFLNSLKLYEYVVPNLFYDEKTSNKIKQNLINDLSLTKGMVQAGELIVTKGEIINSKKFLILKSLKSEYEKSLGSSTNYHFILLGQIILIFTSVLVLFLFLYNFRKEILRHNIKTTFILLLVLLMVFASSMILKSDTISLNIIPFAILPIIISTFYDDRLALFIHTITILLIGFIVPNGFEFVFLQFIAGIVAIFSLSQIHRRGQLFLSSILVIISYCIVYFGMAIIQEGNIHEINLYNFAWFTGNGLLLLSAYPLIYLFEKMFGFLSDISLMELSDTNNQLLRELAEKAPGSFQHSLQVASLAEEAIFKLGGNPLLVRTGALYHDIGKSLNPEYFTENQIAGTNPHDKLSFEKSAEIIIGHVTKGVELAKKNKLPHQIISFIETHHGTTQAKYFYRSFVNKYPDKEVDVKKYTYPGPAPFSKETAVLMMADSVEAASRSLKVYTDKTINDIIDTIIDSQISEGQLNNVEFTFKDITTIKNIFKNKIKNIYHTRIEYPEENNT
ncbi:MAG: transmembrane HD family protein [Bacteroidetes bacterium]|nr:MAG: transmembrane HD family protein [Bacteroidota bacterium]